MTKSEFEEELLKAMPRLRVYALDMTRDPDVRDDVVQTALVKMLTNWESFQEGTSFGAWSFTILRNVWRDEIRRRKKGMVPLDEAMGHFQISRDDLRRHIDTMVKMEEYRSLSKDKRLALLLSGAGFTITEMAENAKVSKGTVKSRISRARHGDYFNGHRGDGNGRGYSPDVKKDVDGAVRRRLRADRKDDEPEVLRGDESTVERQQ